MDHTLRLHGVVVGHSELENIDPELGRAWGAFRPGVGYELVQPVFRLFAHAVPRDGSAKDEALLARYYSARKALQLVLQDASGEVVSTSAVHIVDYTVEEGATAVSLDVLIKDKTYWARRGVPVDEDE
jgi:hypothetical protein